jgi:small-conductance mechanosensitive channel
VENALETVRELFEYRELRAATVLLGSIAVAYVAEFVLTRVIGKLVDKTQTSLDDEIVAALRRPVFLTVILIGAWWSLLTLDISSERIANVMRAILLSFGVILWSTTLMRISTQVLRSASKQALRSGRRSIIHPRTIPVFDMLLKLAVVGAAVYFMFLAWKIDVTAWLASAGIIGIAVGFAAKDTLANLFAGIFIIADAPYKVGDFIVLENDLRGRVTSIGIRSTRILTLDDVEITIPNAIIGNSTLINEVGGPTPKQRVKIAVQAAYGTDIEAVETALLSTTEGEPLVCETPDPKVRFRSFGDSGLDFWLLVWIDDAARREELVHILNKKVYRAFAEAGIGIPFPQRDVHLKEAPPRSGQ